MIDKMKNKFVLHKLSKISLLLVEITRFKWWHLQALSNIVVIIGILALILLIDICKIWKKKYWSLMKN